LLLLRRDAFGGLCEAAFHQIAAATAIASGDRTQALGFCAGDQLVLKVPV
jgi:hypothetical protein